MRKILIILLSLAFVPVAAQPTGTHFLIGVLRADGTLVPFAQYGNGGWWNPWPAPRRVVEGIYTESTEPREIEHHSLVDMSEPWFTQCGHLPTSWFFWSSPGVVTWLTASNVTQVRAHSGNNWGLNSDFPKRASKDPLHDIIGVAVTVKQKIEPFIKIETTSTQVKEIDLFLKQIFDGVETSEIERTGVARPTTIAKAETSITVLYRSSSVVKAEHIYYFEAEKRYPKLTASGEPGCYDVSLFQGWISADEKGGVGLMDSNFVFTDCDRKGPSTMIPLGLTTLQEQTFLFVREHGWESESYTILELDESGLHRVLETVGA